MKEHPLLYSARVSLDYRSVGFAYKDELTDVISWFWIGSHADYEKLLKKIK